MKIIQTKFGPVRLATSAEFDHASKKVRKQRPLILIGEGTNIDAITVEQAEELISLLGLHRTTGDQT